MQLQAIIIEDEANSREILRNYLAKYCDEVNLLGEASNIKEGLELIRKSNPDLVFLDIELPDMDGKSILDNIQINYPELPVVMCSSHNTVENVKLTWDMGAKGFLAKPISPHKLKNLLNRLGILESGNKPLVTNGKL